MCFQSSLVQVSTVGVLCSGHTGGENRWGFHSRDQGLVSSHSHVQPYVIEMSATEGKSKGVMVEVYKATSLDR